ncbi:winged helix-turn-helix domain-containing protein [Phytoactinopolyspora limicola]|uniref:winged helix-turn-helix domain-containing protein n=1 Tax=Phytoactinopolyspora limicola TaxID=2715536 RepID=UPI001409EB31|nr:winged helix-turn-helix domain-containing protein [Phytoactinopolyspora limicola]
MTHISPEPFDPHTGPPGYVYQKLADHIGALINAGSLKPGTRLPAEAELARTYDVSVGTLRHAIRDLCARGLVVKIPAKGTYVTGSR